MNYAELKPAVDRPGCVTAYAVLLWLAAAVYICGALTVGVFSLSDTNMAAIGLILALIVAAFAVIPILMGIGLWKMTMWGWWLVVISNGLGVMGGLLNLLGGMLLLTEDPTAIATLCGAVIGLAINGYILYWFITNRVLFGSYTTQNVVGLEGEIIKERVRTTGFDTASAIAIVGMVAVLCLIPIFTIAILTLLGPQIGNVFSRITAGLEATPLPR
ncbi:MAG: hypothetical protein KF770_21105 [Anaerolineae bacterium]|nr:hypothetical protein [Anaerolineae bacterium]